MKKYLILLVLAAILLIMAGCKDNPSVSETVPAAKAQTEPVTEIPSQAVTENPFEFESEIDFSDFETVPLTEPAESEETSAPSNPVSPTNPAVKPTESQVQPTEPEITEPEESQAPETVKPSVGTDGYHNQIVRP